MRISRGSRRRQRRVLSTSSFPIRVRLIASDGLPHQARIEHELIPHLFTAFDQRSGTYLPVQQLAYWYPVDVPVDVPVDEPPSLPTRDGAISSLSSSFAATAAAAAAASASAAAASIAAASTAAASTAAASTCAVSSTTSATRAAEHAHSMGVVIRVIKSARALLRAHAIASSDAVRSQHLDAALALLGTARDSTEASTAERLTCAILAAHPSDSLTELTRLAETALEHDDLAAAQIELDAALALDATHADNYARRANVHVRNSKHRRALADAEKALALEPRHVGARSCLLLSASECL